MTRGNQLMKLGLLAVTYVLLGITLNSCGVLSTAATVTNEPADAVGVNVSTPSRRMAVQMTNNGELIDNGKTFMLEFLLTNHGEDINDYRFYPSKFEAYDNLGNECNVNLIWGQKRTHGGNLINGTFPGRTPVKIQVLVSGFSSQASSFSRIKFEASAYSSNHSEGSEGDFVFKNVMIRRQ
jgi:hypothetical protein